MKKIILSFSALVLTATAYGSGHACEAFCIALDSSSSTLHYLGEVDILAGTGSRETHRLLKNKCQKLVRQSGITAPAMLVDTLDYRSRHETESEHSQSSSSSADVGVSYGESRYRGRGVVYQDYYVDMSVSYSRSSNQHHRQYEDRELDIRLTPSQIDVACVAIEDVANGEIPYSGSIIIN